MFTKLERERYNEDREKACKRLNITKNQYNWLRRKGEELRKMYENWCNGDITNEKAYNDYCDKLGFLVLDYAQRLGLFLYLQTDPRGATIYLDTKEIPENNYTQAVCIY